MLMEIGVDSHRHVVTDTHHGTEGIGTQTHVGVLTHHLETLALLLHRVVIATETVDLNSLCLNLRRLTGCGTLHQLTGGTDAGTSCHLFQNLFTHFSGIHHDLYVFDGRSIVEGDKVNGLRTAVRTHPTLHADVFTVFCALQHINYLCSFHFITFLHFYLYS